MSLYPTLVVSGIQFSYMMAQPFLPVESSAQTAASKRFEEQLRERVQEVARAMGITTPVDVYLSDKTFSRGTTLFPGSAAIVLDGKTPSEAMGFIVKHELSHVKTNDALATASINATIALVTSVALAYFFPSVSGSHWWLLFHTPANLLGNLMGGIASTLFLRYREACADEQALVYCDRGEKEGAVRFFSNQEQNVPITHPPLSIRIKRVELSLSS